MYNITEHCDNYSKTSGRLWQYYRDESNDNKKNSESFPLNIKVTGNTRDAGNTKDIKIAVSLKYFRNIWRTLEMSLLNCEINLILTWTENFLFFLQLEQQSL